MRRLGWLAALVLIQLLEVFLVAGPAMGLGPPPRQKAGANRVVPRVDNVLIVVVDTLRVDRLTAYSPSARPTSPGFDALAADAQLFERAYAHASWTKPSVASMLTGLLPSRHGATTHARALDPAVQLLAERMANAGFETAAFAANGYISERFGFDRGFDEFHNAGTTGRTHGGELLEDLLGWLDAREGGAPFFAYLHTTDVHAPYRPSAETLAIYDPLPYDGPIDFAVAPQLLRSIERGELVPDERDRSRLVALYDAGVSDHDASVVAPLLEGLETRGLLGRTLIVFTSDHGEELFDHGSVGHGGARLWEELVHVPLAIRWPGLASARVRAPVGLVQVAETIADATGVPSDDSLDGRSLIPLLEGRRVPARPVVGETGGLRYAVGERYKLIAHGPVETWIDVTVPAIDRSSAATVSGKDAARVHAALATETQERSASVDVQIDDATHARLHALGYVD